MSFNLFEKLNLSDNVKSCNIWLALFEYWILSVNVNSCKTLFTFILNSFLSTLKNKFNISFKFNSNGETSNNKPISLFNISFNDGLFNPESTVKDKLLFISFNVITFWFVSKYGKTNVKSLNLL